MPCFLLMCELSFFFILLIYQTKLGTLNLYAGQEATVRTGQGTTDWLRIGKGVHQGCVLSPCLFNFYAEYIKQDPTICSLQRDPLDSKTQIV